MAPVTLAMVTAAAAGVMAVAVERLGGITEIFGPEAGMSIHSEHKLALQRVAESEND